MKFLKALILALTLSAQAVFAISPAQRAILNQGPLSSIEAGRSYIRSTKPTLFLDPDYVQSVTQSSVGLVSSLATLYGSTAAFTQGTDANKPILSRPDRVENFVTQSATPSNAAWDKTNDPVTLSENSDSDYLGTATSAHSILATAVTDRHLLEQTFAVTNLIAGGSYRLCADFKYSNHTYGFIGEANDASWHSAIINLSTGAISDSDNATATIEAIGNSWQRVCITFTRTNSTAHFIAIGFHNSSSSASGSPDSFLGTGAEKILFNRPTLQRSSMQPTYIATTTAPIYGSLTGRRMLTFDGTNDSLSSTSALSAVLSASGGTAFSLSVPMFEDANTSCAGAFYSDTSSIFADSGPYFGHAIQSVGPRAYLYNGSVYSCVSLTYALKQPVILTSWYDGANQYAYYNNQAVTQGAGGTAPSSLTGTLYVGSRAAGAYFNGQLGPIITYNRVLTQPERDMIRQILQKFWRVN